MKKRKLKIAFVSFYQGDVNRGVESFAHELATRLSKDHSVVMFQLTKSKSPNLYKVKSNPFAINWKAPDATGTRLRRMYLDYWSRQIAKHAFKVLPSIITGKFDIVIPLNNGFQTLLMRLATIASRSKIVFIGQSGLGWDERVSSCFFPTKYIALSSFQKAWIKKRNPYVPIEVIPNAVDVNRFASKKKKVTSSKRPVIVLVSALFELKRIDLAIRAVAKTNASLLIVGDGPEKERLAELSSELLPNRFKIVSVPYNKIHEVYASADLFTFPTVPWESFGIVLLEAMAAGLPVVATDDPVRREIVGDAGIFVDPTDTEAYVEALEKALKAKWGDKPYNQAKKFDWEKIAEKYENLFLDITS